MGRCGKEIGQGGAGVNRGSEKMVDFFFFFFFARGHHTKPAEGEWVAIYTIS